MARDRRQTKAYKKVEKALAGKKTFSAAGPSLLEILESRLIDYCRKHYELKIEEGCFPGKEVELAQLRGIIHGLSVAVAKIRLPYENQSAITKQVTREFYRKAKEQING